MGKRSSNATPSDSADKSGIPGAAGPPFTLSGIPLKTSYGRQDLERLNVEQQVDVAQPGQFPYTRGIHPTMYRGRLWTMRQFAGFGTARQTNEPMSARSFQALTSKTFPCR
jgi:methylmalonyl-CoA mutase N-terminal domain/subunit